MAGTHIFFLWSVRDRVARSDPDFTVYYTAANILREGRGPWLYDILTQQQVQREFATDLDLRKGPLPYIHPPYEAIVFVPLTFLPYSDAFLAWNVLNLLMLAVIAALLRQALPSLRRIPLWEWMLAMLAFFPVFANFLQGQDAILLLLIYVLAFRAFARRDNSEPARRDADFLAGLWLGLAIFKYHFTLPLALMLAIWRGRKFISGFALTAAAMVVLSLALVGWPGALRYPALTWRIVSVPGHGQTPPGLMPNLLGLFAGWPGFEGERWPVRLLVLATSIALWIAVLRLPGRAKYAASQSATPEPNETLQSNRRVLQLAFAAAVTTSVLVAYNTNAHDLCLLILPIALIADYCFSLQDNAKAAQTSAPAGGNARAIRSLLLPILPLWISPLWIFLWMRWSKLNLMVILLLWSIFALRREIARHEIMRRNGPLLSS